MPDGGPRYKETPKDPWSVPVAEPLNAVTASLFVFIVLAWAVRLRGRYRQFTFITACMPILLAGGIGGTLYHAFRTQRSYFLLDVIAKRSAPAFKDFATVMVLGGLYLFPLTCLLVA